MAEYVRDTFTRSGSPGWGTGEVGGAWTESLANTLSSTTGTLGRLQFQGTTLASTAHERAAAATAARDTHAALRMRIDSSQLTGTGTGVNLWCWLRAGGSIGTPTGYYARLNIKTDASAVLSIGYSSAGTPVQLGTVSYPAATLVAGAQWILELSAIGAPTKVGARFYNTTPPLPAGNVGWIYAGDETGPQTAGVYQISGDRPTLGVAAAQVNDFVEYFATDPPVPAFSSASTGPFAVNFNASSSTGDFTAYSWDWGDGTAAGSGTTPSHTYAAAGTYRVTLTGTTRWGATYVVYQYVTVPGNPPAPTPRPLPIVRIGGVDVCDELYSISWQLGQEKWTRGLAGATCSVRLRGIYPATQGMTLTVAVPQDAGAQPLWSGVVDQVSETHEIDDARADTMVIAMDSASQLARLHVIEPQSILPQQPLPARLDDLRPRWLTYRYRYSGAPVTSGRWLALKKKTAADHLRQRTYLELVGDALTASLAVGYVARDGAIAYAPWEAPDALSSTPRIDLTTGLDCASRVTVDRNSTDGIVNLWIVGSGDDFKYARSSSIEAYGEHQYSVPGDTLQLDADFPFAVTRFGGLTSAMGNPRDAATVELPIVDWAQKSITASPLDLAEWDGKLYAVLGIRHEIVLGDAWRVTLTLDRNPWEIDGRTPP